MRQAEAATAALFGSHAGNTTIPNATDIIQALKPDLRLKIVNKEDILGQPLTKLAAQYGLTRSRGKELVPSSSVQCSNRRGFGCSLGDARKVLAAGGLYLNSERVPEERLLREGDLKDERISILRSGKDNHIILAVQDTHL